MNKTYIYHGAKIVFQLPNDKLDKGVNDMDEINLYKEGDFFEAKGVHAAIIGKILEIPSKKETKKIGPFTDVTYVCRFGKDKLDEYKKKMEDDGYEVNIRS